MYTFYYVRLNVFTHRENFMFILTQNDIDLVFNTVIFG